MHENYARDLDLNLLRVFLVVAETGSVTLAANRLYLTQPAVSSALRRLSDAVGQPLFVREGRGLSLTQFGRTLFEQGKPLLEKLVESVFARPVFDAMTDTTVVRLGLADALETWLLPRLLRSLGKTAPQMKLVILPVQFRTVSDALSSNAMDIAITVADELPSGLLRRELSTKGFVCLYDPKHLEIKRLTKDGRLFEVDYFANEHVIVSYNGDLRGVVEDIMKKQRRVRCSVPSFASIGAIVQGSALIATVPEMVAEQALHGYPKLKTALPPFPFRGTPIEMIWRAQNDDDQAQRFVRQTILHEMNALM